MLKASKNERTLNTAVLDTLQPIWSSTAFISFHRSRNYLTVIRDYLRPNNRPLTLLLNMS
jgi:hypothetical protein